MSPSRVVGRWIDVPPYEEARARVTRSLSTETDYAKVDVLARDLRAIFDEISRLRRELDAQKAP